MVPAQHRAVVVRRGQNKRGVFCRAFRRARSGAARQLRPHRDDNGDVQLVGRVAGERYDRLLQKLSEKRITAMEAVKCGRLLSSLVDRIVEKIGPLLIFFYASQCYMIWVSELQNL